MLDALISPYEPSLRIKMSPQGGRNVERGRDKDKDKDVPRGGELGKLLMLHVLLFSVAWLSGTLRLCQASTLQTSATSETSGSL